MFPLRFFNVLLLATRALSDDDGETSLSKQHRRMILREHNSRRSDLAFGKAKNNNGKWMPAAKNMYKLKYDMSAERTAIEWANECKWKHSTPKQRKGAGQNMMAIYKQDQADTTVMIKLAAKSWWNELGEHGVRSDLRFTKRDMKIGHWTQMAWASTTAVGCGLNWCPEKNMTIFICNYLPHGNIISNTTRIYEKGKPCKSAKSCTTYKRSFCEKKTGLCVRKE